MMSDLLNEDIDYAPLDPDDVMEMEPNIVPVSPLKGDVDISDDTYRERQKYLHRLKRRFGKDSQEYQAAVRSKVVPKNWEKMLRSLASKKAEVARGKKREDIMNTKRASENDSNPRKNKYVRSHYLKKSKITMPYKKKVYKKTYKSKKASTSNGAPNLKISNVKMRMAENVKENFIGMLNPHSGYKPRIMDGAVAESQTSYLKDLRTVTVPANTTGVICILPGLSVITASVADISASAATYTATNEDGYLDTTAMAGASGNMFMGGPAAKWRHVSTGTKVTLLNTSEENDGWFSCYRLAQLPAIDSILVADSTTAGTAYCAPDNTYLEGLSDNTESQNRGSHFAGALKDIDKYYFRLHPYAEEHPFITLDGGFEITATGTYAGGPPKIWLPTVGNSQSFRPIRERFFDDTFDGIVILIKTGAHASSLLLDTCRNIEVVYRNTSNLARFHKGTEMDAFYHKRAHKLMKSIQTAAIAVK